MNYNISLVEIFFCYAESHSVGLKMQEQTSNKDKIKI